MKIRYIIKNITVQYHNHINKNRYQKGKYNLSGYREMFSKHLIPYIKINGLALKATKHEQYILANENNNANYIISDLVKII